MRIGDDNTSNGSRSKTENDNPQNGATISMSAMTSEEASTTSNLKSKGHETVKSGVVTDCISQKFKQNYAWVVVQLEKTSQELEEALNLLKMRVIETVFTKHSRFILKHLPFMFACNRGHPQ